MRKRVPERWSQRTAIKVGVALGIASFIWRVTDGSAATASGGMARMIGYGFGSVIGGVFLSCLVVAVRNRLIFGRGREVP